jgi:uncharacterized protein (TIGR02145 family)
LCEYGGQNQRKTLNIKNYKSLNQIIMKRNLLKIISVAILLLFVTIGCKKDKNVTNVTLDKNNITLDIGETATLKATVYPEDAANKTVNWTSSNTNVATVANGTVAAREVGTATITVTTEDGNYTATCLITVTPEWVEISGVKWAKRNVDMPGTFAAKQEDAGMYYQWGRLVGWSNTDPLISSNGNNIWDDSPYEDGTSYTWDKDNDPCPVGWRVPTISELHSLIETAREWTTINGINGWIFGTEDNTIFLPAAKGREGENGSLLNEHLWYTVNTFGMYWSNYSEFKMSWGVMAEHISFISDCFTLGGGDGLYRSYGCSVRCVAE